MIPGRASGWSWGWPCPNHSPMMVASMDGWTAPCGDWPPVEGTKVPSHWTVATVAWNQSGQNLQEGIERMIKNALQSVFWTLKGSALTGLLMARHGQPNTIQKSWWLAAVTVFSLGSKATFPECSSVSQQTICESIRPDPKLLAAMDLSWFVDPHYWPTVCWWAQFPEAQWQRLYLVCSQSPLTQVISLTLW